MVIFLSYSCHVQKRFTNSFAHSISSIFCVVVCVCFLFFNPPPPTHRFTIEMLETVPKRINKMKPDGEF